MKKENLTESTYLKIKTDFVLLNSSSIIPRADVEHLNIQAGSTFPVPICTVSPGHWVNKADTHRASRCNKIDAVRL